MIDFPSYSLFSAACRSGLSVIRPLTNGSRTHDLPGFNFGHGWPPSYAAFGRMRALTTLESAIALSPQRVLEVAAGDGSLSACLVARGVEVFANDLCADNLRTAVESFTVGDKINLLAGNLLDLDPAQIGLFDLVIACEVIEHVAHSVELLHHLKRFLTPDGHLLLTTPNGSYFRNRLPTLSEVEDPTALEATQFRPDADGHLFLLTPDELRGVAEQAGLCVQQLDLYGTPFLTGHCGFSMCRSRAAARLCYRFEQLTQRLSFKTREKYCFLISALLHVSVGGIDKAAPRRIARAKLA